MITFNCGRLCKIPNSNIRRVSNLSRSLSANSTLLWFLATTDFSEELCELSNGAPKLSLKASLEKHVCERIQKEVSDYQSQREGV